MHEFVAKLARLAVSKAAAFCYAVAVGVAGNLAFNFVQQHHAATATATAPVAAAPSAPSSDPAAPPPVATAPILPQPVAAALPAPDALSVPPLKPAALPPGRPASPVAEATPPTKPVAAAPPLPAPAPAPAPQPSQPLPPIERTIVVAPPPSPPTPPAPASVEAVPAALAATPDSANPAPPPAQTESFGLSDLLHPTRIVGKGLHWAGEKLPIIGTGDASPVSGTTSGKAAAPAAPISLLPPVAADAGKPPGLQARPGHGTGGLY